MPFDLADVGDTMAYFDLEDHEWEAIPLSVQDKLRSYVGMCIAMGEWAP